MNNVVAKVKAGQPCVGCGMCAGVCPNGIVEMQMTKYGEYRPSFINPCKEIHCGLCLSVCPFSQTSFPQEDLTKELFSNTPTIQHHRDTGYYMDCFSGYRTQEALRLMSASGGLATALFEALLETGKVDRIIAVSPNQNNGSPLFSFRVCRSIEELRSCSRSCYYPVEVSKVIRHVLNNDFRYAFIGLPCICRAIRLSQRRLPKLKKRIPYLLGLVCGQGKTAGFLESAIAMGGGNPHLIRSATFRTKSSSRPATDYGLSFVTTDVNGTDKKGTVYWSEGMNRLWVDRLFTIDACNTCTDLFAECADIAFMDAWLEGYQEDWRGSSLVLSRSENISHILQNTEGIYLERIAIRRVIASQSAGIGIKKSLVPAVIPIQKGTPYYIDGNNFSKTRCTTLIQRLEFRKVLKLSKISKDQWIRIQKDYDRFNRKLRWRRCVNGAMHKVFRFVIKSRFLMRKLL